MKKFKIWRMLAANLMLASLLLTTGLETTSAADTRSTDLWTQWGQQDWAGWRLNGLSINGDSLTLDANAARSGNDPYGAGAFKGGNYYNGGSYYYGEAVAPYYGPSGGFDNAVASWNADTPAGTWLAVKMRALIGTRWTKYYVMGVWASDTGTVRRHSVDGQGDSDGKVETDTLVLNNRASAFQVSVALFSTNPTAAIPTLRRISVSTVHSGTNPAMTSPRTAWGKDLAVPERSQMIYPDGGEVWCSPTSTSMVMAFYNQAFSLAGLNRTVPDVAALTYDWIYRGNGNWPFNVAVAASGASGGLSGYVSRFVSLVQVESWIAAGYPVITSVAYTSSNLPGAPIPITDGHLIVIRGFDASGNVIVNDPAADPRTGQKVRIVYPRAAFERAWQNGSGGTVYLLFPKGAAVPSTNASHAWEPLTNGNPQNNYAYAEFENLWAQNDLATIQGSSGRGWVWGPGPYSGARQESYAEGPDGTRVVQYFDKSRMEITNPSGDRTSKWFVTNGLLTVELVSGRLQTGDNRYEDRSPAQVSVAGDPGSGPTYAMFNKLASLPGLESSRRVANLTGQSVTAQLDQSGNVTTGSGGATYAKYDNTLGHNIPDVLWSWMNNPARSGMDDWVFVLGYPISEPYWVNVNVSGKPARVLVQLFQRRALTCNPANAAAWQVEMGNIGQHYYRWRYNG